MQGAHSVPGTVHFPLKTPCRQVLLPFSFTVKQWRVREGNSSKVTAGKESRKEVHGSHVATLRHTYTHRKQEAEHGVGTGQRDPP